MPVTKYSRVFGKTLREEPKEADSINHRLLVRAGYIRQLTAGVYTYLLPGLRVLNNISQIIREEMDNVGGREVLMPLLHPSTNWKQTGGWEGVDVLYKLKSRTDKEYALAQSHEEVVTPLVKEFIHSHKDLPLAVYHIQWKFRDELRVKSGILRGREFLMKDMYSFHADQQDFDRYYMEVKKAYLKIFQRLGLAAKTTEASGGNFSDKISYEFEVLTDAGEANILYCDSCVFCVNVDDIRKYKTGDKCPRCGQGLLKSAKAAEVGNIFDLGQKYSRSFDLTFIDPKGQKVYPVMGCYGIGITRVMGVLVEKYHDEKGIIWPESIAPYKVHLITLDSNIERKQKVSDKLDSAGIEVLWDDRNISAGVKFADADLIGIPYRVVISDRTGDKVEVKKRNEAKCELVDLNNLILNCLAK